MSAFQPDGITACVDATPPPRNPHSPTAAFTFPGEYAEDGMIDRVERLRPSSSSSPGPGLGGKPVRLRGGASPDLLARVASPGYPAAVFTPPFAEIFAREELLRNLAVQAESFCGEYPDLSLIRCRQLVECLARRIVDAIGEPADHRVELFVLIRTMEERELVSWPIRNAFHRVRKAGNRAVHSAAATLEDARRGLTWTHAISVWFQNYDEPERQFACAPPRNFHVYESEAPVFAPSTRVLADGPFALEAPPGAAPPPDRIAMLLDQDERICAANALEFARSGFFPGRAERANHAFLATLPPGLQTLLETEDAAADEPPPQT